MKNIVCRLEIASAPAARKAPGSLAMTGMETLACGDAKIVLEDCFVAANPLRSELLAMTGMKTLIPQ